MSTLLPHLESLPSPEIFTAYSQALVLAKQDELNVDTKARHERLVNALAGVVFLGTPHAGSSYSELGKVYCLFHYWQGANPMLLGYLDPGSAKTRTLEDHFARSFPNIAFDFYETLPNSFLGIPVQMVSITTMTQTGLVTGEPIHLTCY